MKKFVKVASAVSIVLGMGMGTAQAENSLQNGSFALNMQISDSILGGNVAVTDGLGNQTETPLMVAGKFMIAKDAAVLLGFGLGIYGGDGEGTDLAIKGGYRSYMSTADFAPFVGASFAMKSYNDGDTTETFVLGEFGAEYFLSRQFSVEGSAYAGYGAISQDIPDTTASRIGTYGSSVSVNYYF